MPAPSPLWSGDRDPGLRDPEPDAPTDRLPAVAQEEPTRPQEPAPAFLPPVAPPADRARETGGRRPRRRGLVLGLVVGAVLAIAAFSLGALLTGNDSSSERSKLAEPLGVSKGGVDATRAGAIYARDGRSVLQVRRAGGSGTGFIVEGSGRIVTNAHVVGTATNVQVVLEQHGSKPIPATVIGRDESSDLAVLKVDPAAIRGRPALPLADSDKVNVGDLAVAIGFPLGLDRTVTAGIISGVGREITAPNNFQIDKVLQTDAPINPGNSGGPLLDARGRVVGVNSQIATAGGGGGNVGIGFAVPSNALRDVVPKLSAGQKIDRPYIGISTSPPADGSQGAQVAEIRPGGPAAAAGFEAPAFAGGTGGDTIVAIDGKRVTSPEGVAQAIAGKAPGDKIAVQVRRRGDLKTLSLTLGNRPATASP